MGNTDNLVVIYITPRPVTDKLTLTILNNRGSKGVVCRGGCGSRCQGCQEGYAITIWLYVQHLYMYTTIHIFTPLRH